MAEAYYGIPVDIALEVMPKLSVEFIEVLGDFEAYKKMKGDNNNERLFSGRGIY